MKFTLIGAAVLVAIAAVPIVAIAQEPAKANAKFIGADGSSVGTAEFTETKSGVLVTAEVSGLPAGQWVGFHVHQTGTCDHTGGHESAGGHFNPGGKEHGYNAANGPHAGDMPNQYVAADGKLHAQVLNTMVTLGDGANSIKGRALMVHAGKDDYAGQPSGNAGKRLACAVIE